MAVLTDEQRREVWRNLMKRMSERWEPIAISKTELRDAVNAIDQFFEDNAAAINNALPAPAKAGLTISQKAELLAFVALKRYG